MKHERKLLDLDGKDLDEAIAKIIVENPNNDWTEKEVRILTVLANNKIPTRIIAEKLGRTYDAVRVKRQSLGLSNT